MKKLFILLLVLSVRLLAQPAANYATFSGDVTNTPGFTALTVSKIGGVSISLSGAFTTSGANTLTLTTAGNTNVTLPTSGTLAALASPAFTGSPTAPTQTVGDNTTKLATDAFVIANAGGGSGTVTHTSGALTSTDVVVGNGGADIKVTGVAIDASNNMTGINTLGVTTLTVSSGTTGTGNLVFGNSPVLITPTLGTPGSVNLANATNLQPTAIAGLGTGVETWMVTPSGTNLAAALTSALPVSAGGTGAATFAADGILYGNGTGAIGVTTVGTSGNVLTSNGTGVAPTFQPASGGSTGISGATSNGAMYATGATTGTSTGALTNGQILIGSTGTTPAAATIMQTANQTSVSGGAGSITIALAGPHNFTTQTVHGVLVGEASSAIAATAAGTANQALLSGGASADPAYSTATYPASTTVSQILYSSSANVIAGLTTANNSILATNGTGVPSIGTALPSGITGTTQLANDSSTKIATTAFVNVATHGIGTVTTTATVDWSLSTGHTMTLTATDTCVVTFSNAVDNMAITVDVTTASTAAITWPPVLWTGGSPPTQSTTGHHDFYTFKKVGSNIIGNLTPNCF